MAMRYVHAHTAEVSVRNSAPPLPAGTFYAGLFAYTSAITPEWMSDGCPCSDHK